MSFVRFSLLASILYALAACSSVSTERSGAPVVEASPANVVVPDESRKAGVSPWFRLTTFAALPGWNTDNQREAWPAFLASCSVLGNKTDWKTACNNAPSIDAGNEKAVRLFFETYFSPYQIVNPDGSLEGTVTGYYEPLLRGARKRGGAFQTPVHRVPDDILTIDEANVYPELKGLQLRGRLVGGKVVAYPTRAELMQSNVLAGKEILWVDDPIDAFFLQVQGSGRVQLIDAKETVRVAYADQNGQPYKSIGKYLIDKGELTLDQASMQGIKAWVAAHPSRQQELLNANPRYIFFREEKIADPNLGPKGALGVPLTPQRSIAVDPQFIPLGAPVFLATTQPNSQASLQRLMLAQDTGSAIKSAVRADFFWGFGAQAGDKAGKMKQRGAMWVLLPK